MRTRLHRNRSSTPEPTTTLDADALPWLLEVPHAAKLLGISRSAAYRLAASEELPVQRLGGRVYVVTAKLLELVKA